MARERDTDLDRLLDRCAFRIVPVMAMLYLVSLIDRLNVGFAALTMNADLKFSPAIYGLGAGLFFVGYFLFQVPSSLILERVGARRWLFVTVSVWGAVSAANAVIGGAAAFYLVRFFLGAAEAGLFPGLVLYLTFWFPERHRARHIAHFMSASPFAFMVGGPIASLVLGLGGGFGLKGWQWLFLFEALPAFLLAGVVWKALPDGPSSASFLSAQDKRAIAAALAADPRPEHEDFGAAITDYRLYALGAVYVAVGAGGYGIRLWLPQIVQGMGFSVAATGLLVALPYALAMMAMVVWGRASDRKNERVWHVVLPNLLAAGGFLGAALLPLPMLGLLCLVLVVIGLDAVIGPFWALPASFLKGRAAAGGIAVVNTFGTGLGGFLGPVLIGASKEATGTYASSMLALGGALICSCLLMLALSRRLSREAIALKGDPRPI